MIWAIGLSLGGTTGYAINPARDLGPRIAHAMLPLGKKAGSNWEYAAIPVVGPLLGAMLAGISCARRISKTTLVIFHLGINSYFAN